MVFFTLDAVHSATDTVEVRDDTVMCLWWHDDNLTRRERAAATTTAERAPGLQGDASAETRHRGLSS